METETTMASHVGNIPSKKIGKASIQMAFEVSKVTKSKCLCLITLMTLLAFILSSLVPVFNYRSIVRLSIDKYPTVSPENIPEANTRAMLNRPY